MTRQSRGRGRGAHSQRTSDTSRRPQLTHFLCIPLVTAVSRPQLEQALERFQELPKYNLFHQTAVRPVGSLHLTLGVMSLTTDESLQAAISLLQSVDVKQLLSQSAINEDTKEGQDSSNDSPLPLQISLKSLASMQSPMTSVLYAVPTDPTNRLQVFGEKLRALLAEPGLLLPDNRPLKLHATIVNTIYSKGTGFPSRFNPSSILDDCNDFVWLPSLHLNRIAICKMGAKKVLDDKGNVIDAEYEEVASMSLPD